MSVTDQIYLATGLPPDEVAARIASSLEFDLLHVDGVHRVVWRDGEPWFGGEVGKNGGYLYQPEDHTPDEDSVMDGYDMEWTIGSSAREEALIHRAAREAFDKVAARLPWPALLVEDVQRLKAAFRPGEGVVEFPPNTSPDSPGRALWRPFALPR